MFKKLFPPSNKQKMKKKRISPNARSPDGFVQPHPMYQYAVNEYNQTVAPTMSNDDGHSVFSGMNNEENINIGSSDNDHSSVIESALPTSSSRAESDLRSRSPSSDHHSTKQQTTTNSKMNDRNNNNNNAHGFVRPQVQSSAIMSPQAEHILNEVSTPLPSPPHAAEYQHNTHNTSQWPTASEPTMPDTTYEEYYGDAYVGGPIRYIYPSGYQSMRPRSGPWKLSIAVCLMMSWLSVFIIGHCSDRVDQSLYNQNEIDDDTFVIEIRWCGSRLLYCMWVISMLITGIATAYCSVIGYIKVRDFAVGNMRSQPPGMVGKSDYYVQIQDDDMSEESGRYQKTIYQADGTPQFWGHHIYRPTQAAVAITSR